MNGLATGSTRSRMTHGITSPPSIDALRKVYSINSSAVVGSYGGAVCTAERPLHEMPNGMSETTSFNQANFGKGVLSTSAAALV
jgi:hypothetical protein